MQGEPLLPRAISRVDSIIEPTGPSSSYRNAELVTLCFFRVAKKRSDFADAPYPISLRSDRTM